MRIRCPSCSATYDVADALLDPPRTVRCARCAHDWTATPLIEDELAAPEDAPPASTPAPAAAAPVATAPPPGTEVSFHEEPVAETAAHAATHARAPKTAAPSAIERLSAAAEPHPPSRRAGHLLTAAWAASFLILAGLGAAAYVKRDALMRLWPASARVYAMIGLAPGDPKAVPTPAAADKPAH